MRFFGPILLGLTMPTIVSAQLVPEMWSLIPDLRIGSLDAANYSLTEVSDLEIGSTGKIYVGQDMEKLIRVYDADGRFLKEIGREGFGPGEFQSVSRLGWKGDSLWVVDWVQSRVSLFNPAGDHLRTFRFQGPLLEYSSRPTRPSALLPDGSILGVPSTGNNTPVRVPLLRMGSSGNVVGTVGRLVSQGAMARIHRGDRVLNYRIPVRSNSLWDQSPDGSFVVLVHRALASDSETGSFRVERFDAASDTVFSRRYRYPPKPVPEVSIDSARAWLRDVLIYVGEPPGVAEQMAKDSMQIPRYQPPITQLTVGRDSTIWLRREGMGVKNASWLVLDGAGDIIAKVTTPPGLSILQAQRDMVWGVVTDDLDIPYIVRYRVTSG